VVTSVHWSTNIVSLALNNSILIEMKAPTCNDWLSRLELLSSDATNRNTQSASAAGMSELNRVAQGIWRCWAWNDRDPILETLSFEEIAKLDSEVPGHLGYFALHVVLEGLKRPLLIEEPGVRSHVLLVDACNSSRDTDIGLTCLDFMKHDVTLLEGIVAMKKACSKLFMHSMSNEDGSNGHQSILIYTFVLLFE